MANDTPSTLSVSGGDVVCKEVTSGPQSGLSCSLISWCVGRRCLTSGSYESGDVIYKASYTKGVKVEKIGTVTETLKDDMPDASSICMMDIDDDVSVDSYKLYNRKIQGSKDPISGPGQFHLEVTEPASGRFIRHFGNYDLTATRPQPGVMPIATNTGRLKPYHQGSVFRFGNNAMCIYNGMLQTDTREYAACFETSRLCAFHPEWCGNGKAAAAAATAETPAQ